MSKTAKDAIAEVAIAKTKESQRDLDLRNLAVIADKIDRHELELATLYDARRKIWHRRLESKDTTKAQLARVSRCTSMNITQGLKPSLMKKMSNKK